MENTNTNTKTKIKLTVNQMRKISRLYDDYIHIDDDSDLRRRHLQLVDYQVIPELANRIQKTGEVRTFMQNVAEYFRRFGFTVTMDENNINYIIRF